MGAADWFRTQTNRSGLAPLGLWAARTSDAYSVRGNLVIVHHRIMSYCTRRSQTA